MKTETKKDFIDYAKRLYWLDVTVSKLEKEQNKLSKKFGAKASANDAIWSILNRSLEAGNFDRNAKVYREMARVLEAEGKDFNHLIAESQKQGIMSIKQRANELPGYIGKIIISSYVNDDLVCEKCRELSGREFSVEESIENIPLPAEVCESEHGCRCAFGFETGDIEKAVRESRRKRLGLDDWKRTPVAAVKPFLDFFVQIPSFK